MLIDNEFKHRKSMGIKKNPQSYQMAGLTENENHEMKIWGLIGQYSFSLIVYITLRKRAISFPDNLILQNPKYTQTQFTLQLWKNTWQACFSSMQKSKATRHQMKKAMHNATVVKIMILIKVGQYIALYGMPCAYL